jgi:hypothetical protein
MEKREWWIQSRLSCEPCRTLHGRCFSKILSYLEAFNMVTARGTARDLQQTRNEISGYSIVITHHNNHKVCRSRSINGNETIHVSYIKN